MTKTFPIDYIRQIIEQTLLEEHVKQPTKYIGGENQVNLFSFYEQLVQNDEVDRFTERYRDLVDQQNRSGLIANGVILAPENPTITNINQALIVPMTFTVNFRCTLKDRDLVLESLNHLIEILKGRKVDIAELDNGKLFKVGTFGNNVNGTPLLKIGDYIGDELYNSYLIGSKFNELMTHGFTFENIGLERYFYTSKNGKLIVMGQSGLVFVEYTDDGTHPTVIFPPEHKSFKKYKVSISFDSIRCDEPRTLNAQEYCTITLGGSATLCDAKVRMGNDILKLGLNKLGVIGSEVSYNTNKMYWLEPLEIPSGSNANILQRQIDHSFITKSHTNALTINIQYTFLVDTSIELLKQWYDYARYGELGINQNEITPNLVYGLIEIYNTWGDYELKYFTGRIVENIDIENTESDILSLSVAFQLTGELL